MNKSKGEAAVQLGAFGLLFAVSTGLSLNLFFSFSPGIFGKILFVAMAIGIECGKMWALLKYKQGLVNKNKGRGIVLAVFSLTVVFSLLASFGYVLSEIDLQGEVVAYDDQAILKRDLETIDRQLEVVLKQLENVGTKDDAGDYRRTSEDYTKRVIELQEKREVFVSALGVASKGKSTKVAGTIFDAMGIGIIKGELVRAFLMGLLSVSVELLLIATAPAWGDQETKKKKNAFKRFSWLIKDGFDKQGFLNPVNTICKKTGKSADEVNALVDSLKRLKIGDSQALVKVGGLCKINPNIKDVING